MTTTSISGNAAADPAPSAPDFHEWLEAAVEASGASWETNSRALACPERYLRESLRRSYPRSHEVLVRIAEHFHADPGWTDGWWRRAVSRQTRFGIRPSRSREHPAGPILRAALERKGLTLTHVAERCGFNRRTLSDWLSGKMDRLGVFRDRLERVVEVLEAPELLDAIPWRWRRWTLTCSRCKDTRDYEPGEFRCEQRRGIHPEAVVDESTGQGEYTCGPCKQTVIAKASPVGQRIAKLRRKGGRQALRARVLDVRDHMATQQQRAAWEKAQAVNRVRPRTEEERRRLSWAHVTPRPNGRFGLCHICWLLTYAKRSEGRVEAHQTCQLQYRREHPVTLDSPPYPKRGRGYRHSPDKLAETFEIAVRHLLKGEDLGDLEKGSGLAGEFHEYDRTLRRRINALIEKFPLDGHRTLRFWGRALRWARSWQQLQAWLREQGRPKGYALRRLSLLRNL